MSGTASDATSGVKLLSVNGNSVAISAAGTFTYVVSLASGSNRITVIATDNAGNASTETWTVTYDNEKPFLSLDPVLTPSYTTMQTLTGTREKDLMVSLSCPTALAGAMEYPAEDTWRAVISGLSAGENVITLRTLDLAGNETTINASITLITVIPGDVNNDMQVGLDDAILALQVFSGIVPENALTIYREADINGDQRIGLQEVLYVLQKAAGLR